MTINQIRRERLGELKKLLGSFRPLEQTVDKTQNLVRRLVNRKSKIPDIDDMAQIIEATGMIETEFNRVIQTLETVEQLFQAL